MIFNCVECGKTVQRAQRGAGFCRPCAQKRNSAARKTYERTGRDLTCAQCGKEFYARTSEILGGRRFCSKRCDGQSRIIDPASRNVTCSVCGRPFEYRQGRKTCSEECSRKGKSRAKAGEANPNYKTGKTAARRKWTAAMELKCRRCGRRARHQHHVVYEQHVLRMGGDPLDPDNGLSLCFSCHMSHHHSMDGKLPLSILRPENIAFAERLLGAAAVDYFARYYEDDRSSSYVDAPWLEVSP